MESIEQMIHKIDIFFVKDKEDVLKAHHCLKKFGIPVFKSEDSLRNFEINDSDINNNYLIKDNDGWRIQSHYIGNGFPVEELVILSEAYGKKIESSNTKIKKLGDQIIRMIESGDAIDSSIHTEYNQNVRMVKKSVENDEICCR